MGFIVHPTRSCTIQFGRQSPLWATDVSKMRVKELRDELESYGISTKSFFEKSELVEAVLEARKEGKKPINGGGTSTSSTSNNQRQQTTSASNTKSKEKSQQERKAEYQKIAQSMKVADLKQALNRSGVSTTSFFEKSEFVKAYVEMKLSNRGDSDDPDYRDVVMQKLPKGDPRVLTGKIIDVTPNP